MNAYQDLEGKILLLMDKVAPFSSSQKTRERISYKHALSGEERGKIENHLMDKWKIQ